MGAVPCTVPRENLSRGGCWRRLSIARATCLEAKPYRRDCSPPVLQYHVTAAVRRRASRGADWSMNLQVTLLEHRSTEITYCITATNAAAWSFRTMPSSAIILARRGFTRGRQLGRCTTHHPFPPLVAAADLGSVLEQSAPRESHCSRQCFSQPHALAGGQRALGQAAGQTFLWYEHVDGGLGSGQWRRPPPHGQRLPCHRRRHQWHLPRRAFSYTTP